MKTIWRYTLPFTLASVIGLSACGGGSGSSSSVADQVAEKGTAAATADYSGFAAADMNTSGDESATMALDMPTLDSFMTFGIAKAGSGQKVPLLAAIPELVSKSMQAGTPSVAGVVNSGTVPCDSGTLSGTVSQRTEGAESTGDWAHITFTHCVMGSDPVAGGGIEFNGEIGLVHDLVTGDPDNSYYDWSHQISVGYSGFTLTDLTTGDYFSLNGGYTASESHDASTTVDSYSFSGSALRLVVGNTVSGPTVDLLLTGFDQQVTVDASNNVTWSNDMTLSSLALAASITLDTSVTFEKLSYETHPHVGTITVIGANNAKIQVEVGNASADVIVRRDLAPANVDGSWDIETPMTWAEFDAL